MRVDRSYAGFGFALLLLLAACGGEEPPPEDPPWVPPPALPAGAGEGPPSPEASARAEARALASAAIEKLATEPAEGLVLARAAARLQAVGPEVAEALHRALAATRTAPPFDAHRQTTLVAHWSPSGERVLTTSLDMTARLWTRDGVAKSVLSGHVASIHQAAFSPDGRRIVTASVDHTARIWDGDGSLLRTLRGHEAEVVSAAFSPDGTRVLTVSLDGTGRLWNEDGSSHAVAPETSPVSAAWWAAEGPWDCVALLENAQVTKWSTRAGFAPPPASPWGEVAAVASDSHGSRFAILTEESTVHLLAARTDAVTSLRGHDADALGAAFSPDGDTVATTSLDGTARLWGRDGRERAVLRGHGGAVHAVSFAPDGRHVLTVSADRTARVWDLGGKSQAAIGSKDDPVVTAAFSPAGDRILTTPYRRGMAKIWGLDGDLRQVLPDDTGRTLSAEWSPGGDRVLTVDRTLTPHVFVVALPALLAEADARIEAASPSESIDYPAGLPASGFSACRPPPLAENPPRRGDYAGTVVCASCHREAYEGWARSSHARTSYFANSDDLTADVLEEKTVAHPPGSTTYRRDGDGWIARTLGEDGEEHDYPLVMVSGHLRVRFFMTRLPDGRIQVLPAMYELPTGRWFDYSHLIFGADTGNFETPPTIEPGAPTFWTGPVRSWDAACSNCHMSGRSAVDPGPGKTGPRIVWRAHAVDCEACHGPGRLHAEAWQRLEMDEALPKLEELETVQRTTLCTRCHQEGEILERPYFLGQDIYDYIDPTLVIDPERADPAGRPLELIYDGLPFSTSTCAHAGGLTCSTCHAPHGSATRSLLRRPHEDGSFCADCHADLLKDAEAHHHHDPQGSGATCVACHMPFLTIERGHGAIADHTIGIPRLGLTADRVQPDACTWCHTGGLGAPEDAPRLGADALKRAYERWWPSGEGWPQPWMEALARARLGEEGAGSDLVRVIENRALPREVRASAARLLGRYAEQAPGAIFAASRDDDSLVRRSALKALGAVRGERADARLREALADESWAVRLAAARTAFEGWTRVQENRDLLEAILPILEEDTRRAPGADRRWFRLGAAYDILGDYPRALAAYERQIRLDPLAHAVRLHVKNLRALLGKD